MAANGVGQPVVPSLELVAEGQDLGAEPGVRLTVDDQGFQHQTDNSVGKREEHDGRGSQRRLNTRRCPTDELTRIRVTASKDDEVVSFLLPLSSSRSVVARHPRKHVDAEPSTRAWTSTVGCGSMDRPGWFGWWRCNG